ncbi:MAG: hypothetical protein U5L09_13430 [Bacteroidales bacterium]|nr:hypothetical protein [Bacteroidales bacterium]
MLRKEKIFTGFLSHELLKTKYKFTEEQLDISLIQGLRSDVPIIKTIAIIVDELENGIPISDNSLKNKILQDLNNEAI